MTAMLEVGRRDLGSSYPGMLIESYPSLRCIPHQMDKALSKRSCTCVNRLSILL